MQAAGSTASILLLGNSGEPWPGRGPPTRSTEHVCLDSGLVIDQRSELGLVGAVDRKSVKAEARVQDHCRPTQVFDHNIRCHHHHQLKRPWPWLAHVSNSCSNMLDLHVLDGGMYDTT